MDLAIKPVSGPGQGLEAGGVGATVKKIENQQAVSLNDRSDAKKEVSPKEVDQAASDVQILLKRLNTELRLEVNKDSKEVVVKIIDPETDRVIKQIPSEELLAIKERIGELIGVLFKSKT